MNRMMKNDKRGNAGIVRRGAEAAALAVTVLLLSAGTLLAGENAADLVKMGDSFYRERARGHQDDVAATGPVEQAMEAYLKAYEMGDDSPGLVARFMQATYFYATYAESDKKKQKDALQRAIDMGEKALEKNPDSGVLNYQLGGCWGRWGEVNGVFASAKEGVADRVREHAQKVVKADPSFAEAGGYRTLGRLHFLAPRIPFILSWPRHKKSIEYLEKAVKEGPGNLTNHLFYAESLIKSDRYEEALKELKIVLDAEADGAKVVEVLRDKKEARALMDKYGKKMVARKSSGAGQAEENGEVL